MTAKNLDQEICITSVGCILPQSYAVKDAWENIWNHTTVAKKPPVSRCNLSLLKDIDLSSQEPIDSIKAAFIEDELIHEAVESLEIDTIHWNRLEIMTLKALSECLEGLPLNQFNHKKFSLILGKMTADESYYENKFYDDLLCNHSIAQHLSDNPDCKKMIEKYNSPFRAIPTELFGKMKKRYKNIGESFFVNAACASSHAAIDVSCQKLIAHEIDVAITGGIEANLMTGTFLSFSVLGALSQSQCRPFDINHDGLIQGEGCVLITLQRLNDALAMQLPILGIIKGIGSSSDGKGSSLFAPSVHGQYNAYQRAYQHLASNHVDYIEGHGTGTKIGDQTEIRSLAKFFKRSPIPLGSCKSIYGHTRGAAGAVSILKALLMFKYKKIPPSAYIHQVIQQQESQLFINRHPIHWKEKSTPYRIGVSSFGFGGINYHIVIDEYKKKEKTTHISSNKKLDEDKDEIILSTHEFASLDMLSSEDISRIFHIPIPTVKRTDNVHKMALIATQKILSRIPLNFSYSKHLISVVAASTYGLKIHNDNDLQLKYAELALITKNWEKISTTLDQKKEEYLPTTEDTIPGGMNNVISGRIANHFNFDGYNFNIDGDQLSLPMAMNSAKLALEQSKADIVIVIHPEESIATSPSISIERKKVSGYLLCKKSFALDHNFPIKKLLKNTKYYHHD